MPIIRRRLTPDTVYPEDIRYNATTDTVQRKINDEWVDSPDSDPRRVTTLPPHMTPTSTCSAAASVSAAFEGQIAQILTAIEGAATAFSIAGLILGLFSFGVFEIFISLALAAANAMIAAGSEALGEALTPDVWHTFTCILDCHMDAKGRVKSGEFEAIITDVAAQLDDLAAGTINSFLALAGEAGVNNLAAIGTVDGDCSDCGCDDCMTADHKVQSGTLVSITTNDDDNSITIVVDSVPEGISQVIRFSYADTGACCWVKGWTFTGGIPGGMAWYYYGCDWTGGAPSFVSGDFVPGCTKSIMFTTNTAPFNTPFQATITFATCPL